MQEIFKKPDPPQGNTGAKIRKPLTASQKRRMQKAKYYKELEKKQADKAKERAETEKVLRPCKYYQSGNCNKVSFLQTVTVFLTMLFGCSYRVN